MNIDRSLYEERNHPEVAKELIAAIKGDERALEARSYPPIYDNADQVERAARSVLEAGSFGDVKLLAAWEAVLRLAVDLKCVTGIAAGFADVCARLEARIAHLERPPHGPFVMRDLSEAETKALEDSLSKDATNRVWQIKQATIDTPYGNLSYDPGDECVVFDGRKYSVELMKTIVSAFEEARSLRILRYPSGAMVPGTPELHAHNRDGVIR